MKRTIIAGILIGALIGLALLASGVMAAPHCTLDGLSGEWTDAEFYANMHQAGRIDKPIVGEFFMAEADGTTCVAVKLLDGHTLDRNVTEEHWVKEGGKKMVDDTYDTFMYLSDAEGWEASYPTVGDEVKAHASYDNGETAATLDDPTVTTLLGLEVHYSAASPSMSEVFKALIGMTAGLVLLVILLRALTGVR